MSAVNPVDSQCLSALYPSAIVEACGGAEHFNELKTLDWNYLWGLHGGVKNKEVVTEPIMVGINFNQRPFLILTFDVFDAEGKKVAKKVSEVFHNDPCVYEWNHGIETWCSSYEVHKERRTVDVPVTKMAKQIIILLSGQSFKSYGYVRSRVSYLKLWNKDSLSSPAQE